MTDTLSYEGTLTILTCWCGMRHAVPSELRQFQERQHRDGAADVIGIYCPLGHQHQPAGKGRAQILREQLDAERTRVGRLREEVQKERRSHSATKANLTKAKKRIGKGVCPCCNRSFVQLERHMATKHPDYASEESA
jgi:hypothetical protein